MTDINYIYTLNQFLNNEVDISKLDTEVKASNIPTVLSYIEATETVCNCWFKASLSTKDKDTLDAIIAAHDGAPDNVDDPQYVAIVQDDTCLAVDITDELRDRSGKLRVHQTSRKLGTMVLWTGEGDDPTDPTKVGGGEVFSFVYTVGNTDPLVKYIDFNCVEVETWIHEGYITWKDCFLDTLDLQIVPRVTSTTTSSGTDYALYGGYLIVSAPPGYGNIEVTSDITLHDGGLVYMTNDDLDSPPSAFWNADWNTATKRYENITAAPAGDGRYNMFSIEVPFATFVRKMPLLNSGFIALNSSDTDELGHGMRLKMTADTNTSLTAGGDHDWAVAVTLCMHRSKSV